MFNYSTEYIMMWNDVILKYKMAASSESVSADETSQASSLQMQKLTQDDIFCRIVPALGSISYGYFSIHIMNDSWFKK